MTTIYTVTDLARILKRSRSAIRSLIESGRIVASDVSPDGRQRQYRVTQASLDEFLQRQQVRQPQGRRCARRPVRQYV